MIAMETVLERGFTWWDRALFPRDEFEERTRVVQRAMAAAGLDALTVWSSYYHTDGPTAYLAGWPMGGAVLVLPEGEPILFSPGGSREHYFASMQVWCEMRTTPGGVVAALAEAIANHGLSGGRIGMAGADQIDVGPYRALTEAFAAFELVDFDAEYRALRAPKRPRELIAIENSAAIARRAVDAAEAAFAAGASNAAALVAAERAARLAGARDVRGLVNSAGASLRPYEGVCDRRTAPLVLWVAVDQHGYWATASSAPAPGPAVSALEAMIAAVRPGAACGDIAERGLAAIPPEARAMALSCGLGGGIGHAIDEQPAIVPGNDAHLVEGMVLSLQAFVAGEPPGFATAMARVGARGAELMGPS